MGEVMVGVLKTEHTHTCLHWDLKVKKCTAILCPFHTGRDGCKTNGQLNSLRAKEGKNAGYQ